uniref:TIMELESS-interacting protein n=1 Tax=Steinernema glaseri TaxID=37863 RepID=A0A1I7YB34_9BILA
MRISKDSCERVEPGVLFRSYFVFYSVYITSVWFSDPIMPNVAFDLPEQPESDVEMDSDAEDGGDSDLELQVALREGLLKSDSLNIITEEKRPPIYKKAELEAALKQLQKKLPWVETLDITVHNQKITQEVLQASRRSGESGLSPSREAQSAYLPPR